MICSGLDSCTTHSKSLEKAASYLCYFTTLKDNSPRRKSSEDNQALSYRINPSSRENENQRLLIVVKVF